MKTIFGRLVVCVSLLFIPALLPGCAHVGQAAGPAADESAESANDETYRQMLKLSETILLVQKNYAQTTSCGSLVNGALNGMLQSLDEHSSYLDLNQLQEMKDDTTAHYGGVGLYIGSRDGLLTVISPIEDSPAYRAGILTHDTITEIDGKSTSRMSQDTAAKLMRGPPGSKVVLKITRPNEPEPLEFTLVREKVNIATVKGARFVRDGIAYLRITQFSEPTANAMQVEINKLQSGNAMRGLILDLRMNPGGLLSSAVDVAEKFLARDTLVVSIRDRNGKPAEKKMKSEGNRHDTETPMAILIDRGSASAAEIVAGALRDNRRAVLVGEKTYGKGSVQTILPMSSEPGAAIRLTTAHYYTPSERVIHKHGIEPDISVPLTQELRNKIQTRRMQLEQPRNFTAEEKAGYSDVTDIQLERAADLIEALIALKGGNRKTAAAQEPDPEDAPGD